jgi:predicted  nucleic acid-binding Zn-ribbon protein
MSEREFICLECGTHVESFLDPCPECGSQQFESTTDQSEDGHDEQITGEIAKLTRPVNPIAPATGD